MPKPEKNSDIRLDRHSGSGLRGLPKKSILLIIKVKILTLFIRWF